MRQLLAPEVLDRALQRQAARSSRAHADSLSSARKLVAQPLRPNRQWLDVKLRINVSDPALLDDLLAYLRRCGCWAHAVRSDVVEAIAPSAPVDDVYLRMELDAYLRVWRAMHPGVSAEVLLTPSGADGAGSIADEAAEAASSRH
jgi:hypothetical protein